MNAGALDGLVPKAWKPAAPTTPLHAPLHAPLVATSVPMVAPMQPMMSPMPMSPVPMPLGAKGSWKDVAIAIMQLCSYCSGMDEISIQIHTSDDGYLRWSLYLMIFHIFSSLHLLQDAHLPPGFQPPRLPGAPPQAEMQMVELLLQDAECQNCISVTSAALKSCALWAC